MQYVLEFYQPTEPAFIPSPYLKLTAHEKINFKSWVKWSYQDGLKIGYYPSIYSCVPQLIIKVGKYSNINKKYFLKHSLIN